MARRAEALLLDSDATTSARGTIQAGPGGTFELVLVAEPGAPEIRHRASTCAPLATLAALLVAVAADPVTTVRHHRAASSPRRLEIPAPPDTRSAPARRSSSTTRPITPPREVARERLAGWVRAAAIAGVATLPRIDAGVALSTALGRRSWRIELHVAHLFAQRERLPGLSTARARLAAYLASGRGCFEVARARLGAGVCGGLEVGAITASAERVATAGSDTAAWVAAVAAPTIRIVVARRLELHLGVDGVFALRRPGFALRDAPRAMLTPGAAGARAWVGLAVPWGPGARPRNSRDQDRR